MGKRLDGVIQYAGTILPFKLDHTAGDAIYIIVHRTKVKRWFSGKDKDFEEAVIMTPVIVDMTKELKCTKK